MAQIFNLINTEILLYVIICAVILPQQKATKIQNRILGANQGGENL